MNWNYYPLRELPFAMWTTNFAEQDLVILLVHFMNSSFLERVKFLSLWESRSLFFLWELGLSYLGYNFAFSASDLSCLFDASFIRIVDSIRKYISNLSVLWLGLIKNDSIMKVHIDWSRWCFFQVVLLYHKCLFHEVIQYLTDVCQRWIEVDESDL